MKYKKEHFRIFVVEDDPMYLRMVKYIMELNPDHEVFAFRNGEECLSSLHLQPSIVSLDYSLPDISGEEVLRKIRAFNKNTRVILLSGQNDVATAVKLLKEGAYDYITKDDETKERLLHTIANIKKNLKLQDEIEELKEQLTIKYDFGNMLIGTSKPMEKVYTSMEKALKTNITISITGETGTGKEVVAKSIHFNSERKKGKFIAVNMSAIPKELLESELFGYEKGAFTGANSRKTGYFEQANKGTLFLDEIGEMDIRMQAKILRALQEREVIRVGGTQPVKFDARLIVATHRDLGEEVNKGNFREDLYYRIIGLPIRMPALRERGKDIILLAEHFLKDFAKQNKWTKLKFEKEAKDKLLNYSYPGNVRELKAIIELAAVMGDGSSVKADDISFNSPRKEFNFLGEEMDLKSYNSLIIHHFLDKYNKDVDLVAEKLNIGRSTIYRMIKMEKERDQSERN